VSVPAPGFSPFWRFPVNGSSARLLAVNRGLLQVVFCALLLTLTSSPASGICRPENRVGGSPTFSPNFTFPDSANPVAASGVNPRCGYDFASGVHKYLYVQDNPLDNVDPSGNGDFSIGDSFGINISSILQPLANLLLASAGTPGGISLQQLGAFAPKYPVVVVTMKNGTQYLPETKVKDDDQQNIVGAIIGTPIYIAVPLGVDPQALVDTWTYNKHGKKETGQSIVAFLDCWKPGGPHDYKSLNRPSSEIYDAFGNFEFGASGCGAGFDLGNLLWWGDKAHGGINGKHDPINSADITSGYNSIKDGGTLGIEERSILP
jgi:hypothetical protein